MRLLLSASLLLLPSLLHAQSLSEVYAAALAHSESVAINEQTVREAEALYRAALGGSFPELSYRESLRREDGGSTVSEGAFRISQGGLSGYRQLAGLKAAKGLREQRRRERERAEQLLLSDVAGAFYGTLQSRADVASTRKVIELADKRLSEVSDRVRVGRSREADAVGQRVQLLGLRSQLQEADRLVGARTDLLAFLAGGPVEPAVPADAPPAPVKPLEDYLARIPSRPDVQAAAEAVEAARGRLKLAKADRFPQLELLANLYTHRPASSDDVKWDASAAVGVPLWSWGARAADQRAAEAGVEREDLALRAARRLADLDVRNAWRDLASARVDLEFQRDAVLLARKDYALQTKDEGRGLVTSLEVLESLNRLNDAELAFSTAELKARLAAIQLELAAGARPGELLR